MVDFFSAPPSAGVDKFWLFNDDAVTADVDGDGVKLVLGRIFDFVELFVGVDETDSPPGSGCRFVVDVEKDDDEADDNEEATAEDTVAA